MQEEHLRVFFTKLVSISSLSYKWSKRTNAESWRYFTDYATAAESAGCRTVTTT